MTLCSWSTAISGEGWDGSRWIFSGTEGQAKPFSGSWRLVKTRAIKAWVDAHPRAAQWVRKGGLFVIVSNLITLFKYLLQFLPAAFQRLPNIDFGFPGIAVTPFEETFLWNIIGYDAAHGGLPYFCAYLTAMLAGEGINFFLQRSWVFRSRGNILYQAMWYLAAFCVATSIVNSINCIWGLWQDGSCRAGFTILEPRSSTAV